MITAEQLKDVMERTEALHRYLDIDRKKIEFKELSKCGFLMWQRSIKKTFRATEKNDKLIEHIYHWTLRE